MEYRRLGSSSLVVSRIAFGCMSLHGTPVADTNLLHEAVDAGINLFDTADLYDHGANEELVGAALRPHRNKIYLASKAGNQWRADGSGWDWNPRKEYIMQAAEASLRRLQTDHIDLYQLHGGTMDDDIDECIDAFETLKRQGKILNYGISSIRPAVIDEYVKRSTICSVMMQYSLLDRRPEEHCLPLLLQHEIGVLARGSIAKGLLAGKVAAPFLGYLTEDVGKAAGVVANESHADRSPAQTALRFVLDAPAVCAAVVGIRTTEQLREVAGAIERSSLDPGARERLTSVLPVNRY